MTVENVRKAIVACAYIGLQVIPDACLHPRPFLRATKVEEPFRWLTEWNTTTSHVSVNLSGHEKHSIAEDGVD